MKKTNKNKSILESVKHFIKYNNAFSIGLMIVFIGFSAAFAASPELRENIVSSQDIINSVDNSYILTVNLDNFDFRLKIAGVTENKDNYYVSYTYKTIAIEEYVWQEAEKENTLAISKQSLKDKDLGLYVAEELGENINYELSYLKEVQGLEKQKGLTQKVATIQYAGLVGQFLDSKEKVFPEYAPVVSEEIAIAVPITGEYTPIEAPAQATGQIETNTEEQRPSDFEQIIIKETVDRETIRQIVQELLSSQQATSTPIVETTPEIISSVSTESSISIESPEKTLEEEFLSATTTTTPIESSIEVPIENSMATTSVEIISDNSSSTEISTSTESSMSTELEAE